MDDVSGTAVLNTLSSFDDVSGLAGKADSRVVDVAFKAGLADALDALNSVLDSVTVSAFGNAGSVFTDESFLAGLTAEGTLADSAVLIAGLALSKTDSSGVSEESGTAFSVAFTVLKVVTCVTVRADLFSIWVTSLAFRISAFVAVKVSLNPSIVASDNALTVLDDVSGVAFSAGVGVETLRAVLGTFLASSFIVEPSLTAAFNADLFTVDGIEDESRLAFHASSILGVADLAFIDSAVFANSVDFDLTLFALVAASSSLKCKSG